jgi:hypothetical protein
MAVKSKQKQLDTTVNISGIEVEVEHQQQQQGKPKVNQQNVDAIKLARDIVIGVALGTLLS